MEKSNNLQNIINETLKEEVLKWEKIIPSLKGKHAKRNLSILALLCIHGPKTTWDLAKLYLQKIEPDKTQDKNEKTFFYYRMKENSTIYKRLKFLEEKKYVKKEGKVYYPTSKAFFMFIGVTPHLLPLISFESFTLTLEIQSDEETERFWERSVINPLKGQDSKFYSYMKTLFANPIFCKRFSETFKAFLWGYKINLDEIDDKQLFEIFEQCLKKILGKDKIFNIDVSGF